MISPRAAPNLVHIQYIHRLRDLLNEFLDMVLPEENRSIAITFLAQPFGKSRGIYKRDGVADITDFAPQPIRVVQKASSRLRIFAWG